ncbi:MAG: hypothetical protein GY804_05825 [Alphaproteobacteria bacterium]|nr:hypothetical protein [Alphaproteobacteria bacterium]
MLTKDINIRTFKVSLYLVMGFSLLCSLSSPSNASDYYSIIEPRSPTTAAPALHIPQQRNNISSRTCYKPAGHKVKVNVNQKYGEVIYDHKLSRTEIAEKIQIQKKQKQKEMHKITLVDHTAGLTAVLFNTSLSAKVEAKPAYGGYCVVLKSINLDIGYDDIIVYIDRNFPKGSCPYKTTLDHENTHVGIHQTALQFYTPYIGEKAHEAAQKIESFFTTSIENANELTTKYAEQIGTEIKPTIDFFLNARNAENEKLDTPENYKYTQGMCNDWHKYR